MNLGTIKDKTNKTVLKKRSVKKVTGLIATCCVAVIAVTAAASLTSGENTKTPVLEVPKATLKAPTATNEISKTPKATLSPTQAPSATAAPASSGATVVSTNMLLPVTSGNVLKGYAEESLVFSQTLGHWATHTALDISAPSGTLVLCALDGTVSKISEDALMGLCVSVTHDSGIETVYCALESITQSVEEGSVLLKGQAIGTVGNSASSESSDGAHLHFEVLKDGKRVNPQSYLSGFGK